MGFEQYEASRFQRAARFTAKAMGYLGLAGVGASVVGAGVGEVFFRDQFNKGIGIVFGFDPGNLPESSTDATPGPITVFCFNEIPNCNETNAFSVLRGSGNQIPVTLSEKTKRIEDATESIEDGEFYKRRGPDYKALARAAKHDVEAKRIVEGGSNVTEQVVSNDFPYDDPIYKAKVAYYASQQKRLEEMKNKGLDTSKEIIPKFEASLKNKVDSRLWEIALAKKIELMYTKEGPDPTTGLYLSKRPIMERYLNIVNYGRGARGIGAASWAYFNKPVEELNLVEAAFLAGIPKNPNGNDGDSDPALDVKDREHSFNRRNDVIDAMAANGKISATDLMELGVPNVEKAKELPLGITAYKVFSIPPSIDYSVADAIGARHFLDNVMSQVKTTIKNAGRPDSFLYDGLHINTTLSYPLQAATKAAIEGAEWPRDGRQLAAVVLRQDGGVASEYGGDYRFSQIDMIEVPTHVGSALKPLWLEEAMMSGRVTDLSVPYPLHAIDFNVYPADTDIVWPNGDNGKDWIPQGGHLCRDEAKWDIASALAKSCNDTFLSIALDGAPGSLIGVQQLMADMYGPSAQATAKPSWVLGQSDITPMGLANIYNGLWGNSGISMPDRRLNDITVFSKGKFKQLIDYRLELAAAKPSKQIVPVEIAQKIAEAANGVVSYGTASRELNDMAACTVAKTGTETGNHTAVIVSTTLSNDGNYTAVVKYGYIDKDASLGPDAQGGHLPARIDGEIMRPLAVDGCVTNG